jgi:MarR family transcriptional regulator for hemolysin
MLAEQLAVEGPTLVATIDRLEVTGLMVRVPCEINRRVNLLQLTEPERALFGKIRIQADAFRESTLSQFDSVALRSATKISKSWAIASYPSK